ncbi:hypothetical protein OTU49_015100, partial [Cherax quadricarinatus]
PNEYDITEVPPPEGNSSVTPPTDQPVVVGISWSIKNIYDVNVRDMSVLISMYFRMSWAETRLVGTTGEELSPGEGLTPLHSDLTKYVWTPDLFIHEAREIKTLKMVSEVQGIYLRPPNTLLLST